MERRFKKVLCILMVFVFAMGAMPLAGFADGYGEEAPHAAPGYEYAPPRDGGAT